MTNRHKGLIVDADGHVLEPADTWQKYIEPRYRDHATRIDQDERGWEVLMFDNKPIIDGAGHESGLEPNGSQRATY